MNAHAGRILIVDDEAKNRQLLRDPLEANGHEIAEAENGEQALQLVATNPPDVILLDVMMPAMDGFTVCRRLKAEAKTAAIPILMVTALSDRKERLLGVEAGANDFLTKPIDVQDVCIRVRNAVFLKRLFDELQSAKKVLELKNIQLQEAREAADRANDAKSVFLANVSHELKTPLTAIIGFTEILEERAHETGQESWLPDLRKIQAAAKHQLGLINDLLDISKIEAGKVTLFVEEIDVAQLVEEVTATIQPLVAKNANRLEIECRPQIGAIRADQTKLRQVLFNLLANACKFTSKGVIRLSVKREDVKRDEAESTVVGDSRVSRLTFHVQDTGIGMTPQQLSNLFQVFSQADATIAKKYGGTGLGLALSRKFCRLMGGDLTVVSEFGKGSTFTAVVPSQSA